MRKTMNHTLIALALSLAVTGAFMTRSHAAEAQWLSIPQIHDRLTAAGYHDVEKIEREHGSYRVRATNKGGQRVKLQVNPQTGEIAMARREARFEGDDDDDHHEARHRTMPTGGNGVECSARRCRDDLPTQRSTPGAK